MKKLSIALALAAALAGARTASAATVNVLIHGNSCFNTTPGVTVSYSQWGPFNSSTVTPVTVNCPINLPSHNYTSMYLQVSGWSRNNGANKLSCTLSSTQYDGYNRTSGTATVPFAAGFANTATAAYAPLASSGFPYVTCYIPVNNASGISYLSTIFVQGTY